MAAVGVGLLTVMLHSPIIPAIVIGAVFGFLFLIVATWIGGDPDAADAAWRAEAGDLASAATPATPLERDGEQ